MTHTWFWTRATLLTTPPADAPPPLQLVLTSLEENGWELHSIVSIAMQPEVAVIARAPIRRPTYLRRLWRTLCGS